MGVTRSRGLRGGEHDVAVDAGSRRGSLLVYRDVVLPATQAGRGRPLAHRHSHLPGMRQVVFPAAPLRTVHATFIAHGSPVSER